VLLPRKRLINHREVDRLTHREVDSPGFRELAGIRCCGGTPTVGQTNGNLRRLLVPVGNAYTRPGTLLTIARSTPPAFDSLQSGDIATGVRPVTGHRSVALVQDELAPRLLRLRHSRLMNDGT
jgi:hypothetical protein